MINWRRSVDPIGWVIYIINKSLYQCNKQITISTPNFHLLRFLSRDQGTESSRFLGPAATVIKKEEQSPFFLAPADKKTREDQYQTSQVMGQTHLNIDWPSKDAGAP